MRVTGWMLTGSLILGGPVSANADEASASELERLENELELLQEDLQVSVEVSESFRARPSPFPREPRRAFVSVVPTEDAFWKICSIDMLQEERVR